MISQHETERQILDVLESKADDILRSGVVYENFASAGFGLAPKNIKKVYVAP
uniref:Uncharacterized protein n=1 Tax=viral metagenome TaxID=1070528 RepID=A0A6M3JM57_9ZZZZ